MQKSWFADEDKFQVLTRVLKKSIRGGTLVKSSLKSQELDILEEGVNEGVISKDKLVYCSKCGTPLDVRDLPQRCECGQLLEKQDPQQVQYFSSGYPDIVKEFLGDSFEDEVKIQYNKVPLPRTPVSNLHKGENIYIHISPYYQLSSGIHLFPGHKDAFISWNRVPELIKNSDSALKKIKGWFRSLDNLGEWAKNNEVELLSNRANINEESFPWSSDGSELTMLHEHNKEECNEWSKKKFGKNYETMFERFGVHFLNFLFPYIPIFHAGGGNKPDGYVYLQQSNSSRMYLVESKCWSNKFKLTNERDKMLRYIEDFSKSQEFGDKLRGYIFIAHEFNTNSFWSDVKEIKRRAEKYANLDIICMTDKMMETSINSLGEIYVREPSSPYRILDSTDWYRDIFDQLKEYTKEYFPQGQESLAPRFKNEVLKVIKEAGKEKVMLEKTINDSFGPRSKWQQLEDKVLAR